MQTEKDTPDTQEPEVGQVSELDPDVQPEVPSDLERFFAEIGGDESGLVVDGYRYTADEDGSGGTYRYVHRWEAEKFDLPTVQKMFGGGRWSFRLKGERGKKHLGSRMVEIEGPIKGKGAPAPAEDERSFAETVLDTQHLLIEQLKEMQRGPPRELEGQNPINTAMSIVAAFQTVMAPYQEALLKQKGGGGSFDFDKLVGIFESGVRLGEMASPPAQDPMQAVLAGYLPGVLGAISGNQPPTTPDPVEVLKNPPDGTPMETAGQPQRPPWDILIGPYLPAIFKWAREGKNPELRAEFVVDELTPQAESIVLEQLRRGPAFFSEFMILHPEARPWEEWLAAFWLELANQFEWGGDNGPHPFHGAQMELEKLEENPEASAGVEIGTQ